MEILRTAKENLLEALFPTLCASCRQEIPKNTLLCRVCALSLRARFTTERLRGALFSVSFLFVYKSSPIRGILHALKYSYVTALAPLMLNILEKEKTHLRRLQADLIVPLPLHSRRLRARGFNQSELIAGKLAEILAVPLLPRVLKRKRNTAFQIKARTRAGRARNVEGAFEVKDASAVAGKRVLLVDDVITTGATLNEAAQVLTEAGATRVTAFVLAKD